jgi:hypothetical protein
MIAPSTPVSTGPSLTGARAALDDALVAGEQLLWLGQPQPGLRGQDFGSWILGVPLIVMAVGLVLGAPPADLLPALLGTLPMTVLGGTLLALPLWVRRELRGTWYGVTSQGRALIARPSLLPGGVDRVRSVSAEQAICVVTARRDGSGNVAVVREGKLLHGFMGVADVRAVEDIVRRHVLKDRRLLVPPPTTPTPATVMTTTTTA